MQRDAELVEVIRGMYSVWESGDISGVEALLAEPEYLLGIGTDPREWWVGDAVVNAFRAQVPEMHASGFSFEPGDAVAFREGSVGWIADQPTLKLPDGNSVPMRLTLVCCQDDGDWKIVQFHLSLGVINEEAIGEELTI